MYKYFHNLIALPKFRPQQARRLMIELSDLIENKEKKEVSEFDKLLYRLKDDEDFCNLVEKLNNFDLEKFNKVADYIDLLSK